jgi:hypothetical protein
MTGAGFVTQPVRFWLRLEGLGAGALAIMLYQRAGHSWVLFAILFLAPDVSFLGYLAGARIGAAVYNTFHSYAGPLLLAAAAVALGSSTAIPLIWVAHIGLDRLVGYGLKYPSAFGDTHLGTIGRARSMSTRWR